MLETLKRTKEKIEYNLRIPQYYRKTWIVILVVTLFLLFLSGVGLIIIKVPTDPNLVKNIASNPNWSNAACIIDYIAFGFVALPYLFLSACWIVGIDNITKSKHFHIFVWIAYVIAVILAIIAIILAFRAYIVI